MVQDAATKGLPRIHLHTTAPPPPIFSILPLMSNVDSMLPQDLNEILKAHSEAEWTKETTVLKAEDTADRKEIVRKKKSKYMCLTMEYI
jgi:hypothetical protein